MKTQIINEIKSLEYLQKLKKYQSGYRPVYRSKNYDFGDLVIVVVNDDSFIVGQIINEKYLRFNQSHLRIIWQLGETYHNNDDGTIYVNDFEIWEVLE